MEAIEELEELESLFFRLDILDTSSVVFKAEHPLTSVVLENASAASGVMYNKLGEGVYELYLSATDSSIVAGMYVMNILEEVKL